MIARPLGKRDRGFTLMEVLIVIALLGILASMAVPSYRQSVIRAREAVLRDNLFTLRATIERFTLDQQRPPSSLQELVSSGYLPLLRKDITGSTETWVVEYGDVLLDPAPPHQTQPTDSHLLPRLDTSPPTP